MPTRSEIAYFGAGPAPLPTPIIEAGGQAFVNYANTGLGLAEISHRSPTANKILAEAKQALTTLIDVPEDYEILFMQAGGTGEFSAVVQNLVGVWVERRRRRLDRDGVSAEEMIGRLSEVVDKELKLDYIVTGSWSLKASQEAARLIGQRYVNVACDARKENGGKFGKIPDKSSWNLTPTRKYGGTGSALVYYCDNETVDGVEFPAFPACLETQGCDDDEENERLIVADMSSNFLSRTIDVRKYAVIFGGAQKNVGVTGITIVIVRKSLLPPHTATPSPELLHSLPIGGMPGAIMFDYATIAKNNSLYNTLPIFNLWIASEVMGSLVATFGEKKVGGQEEIADSKAEVLYATLDKYSHVYTVVPEKSVRSRMNVCFRVHGADQEREKEFLKKAEERNLTGLKGHRSVGGIRASNYNAVSMANVQRLVTFLVEYAMS